jgi:phenylalanyl-tRNA synthetase beta chain
MGFESGELVTLENPIGEEYSCLRVSLLPSLLALLKENKHHSLPQQMFELGFVVDGKGKNHRNLGMIKIDAKANYSLCKSLVEAVLRDSGIGFSLAEANHPAFIPGRCATVIKDKTIIGIFGELHPRTITAFKLEHPIIAIELFVDLLHP